MNLKSRIFGFAAASVLALSLTTGVMAQNTTDADVNLVPRNEGACSMTVDTATISFDDRAWTGSAWTNPADTETIEGTVTTPSNVQNCDIQAKSAGLSNQDQERTGLIGLKLDDVQMGGAYATVLSNLTSDDWSVLALLDAAGTDDEPGTYEGVIDFQVVGSGQ